MKVWELQVPVASGFAELLELEVRGVKPAVSCRACGWAPPTEPLHVEWDEGSDIIGDFTFAGARIVIRENVADELLAAFKGFRKGRIKMPDHPKLRKPARITRRTAKRVWLPYEGPSLRELVVVKEVPLLPDSTVTVESRCQACGRIVYEAFEGIEQRTSRGRTPRQAERGLFFSRHDVEGAGFFRPLFTGLTLCTDEARAFIEGKRYSNIELLEVGDITSA